VKHRKLPRLNTAACLVAAVAFLNGPVQAEPLRIAYTSIGMIYEPLWVTQAVGLFNKYNIQAELLYIGGGPPSTQALIAGDVQISFTAAGAVVAASLGGSDVILIGASVDTLPFEIWAVPTIRAPEQLKGTKMGVSRIGATTDFVAHYVLKKLGLKSGQDITIIQAGAGPEVFTALKAGAVQSGVMSTGPYTVQAQKDGFVRLADVSTMGVAYPFGPFAARRSFVREHQDLVARFMKAYIEGIHRFKTDKQLALATLEKYTRIKTSPATEQVYETYAQRYFKRAPEVTNEALQTILEELSASRSIPPGITPQRFADNSFVRALIESGFVDSLYSNR
jgi:ABC-type nitrate/sulfonate/bicarbonate transport system substrate-binding protein